MLRLSRFSQEIDDAVARVQTGDLRGALAALEQPCKRTASDPTSEAYWRFHLVLLQVLGYLGEAPKCEALLDGELAADPPTPELAVALHILRGASYCRRTRYKESKELLHRALELARQLGVKALEAEAHVRCGQLCQALGQHEESEAHFLAASEIGRTLGDRYLEAIAAVGQGKNIMHSGRYAEATEHFREAQRTLNELGERLLGTMLHGQIAWGYINQGNYDAALETLLLAEPALREAGVKQSHAICLADMGYIHMQRGEHAKAVSHYQQALETDKICCSPVLYRKWSNNIAAAYEKMGDSANHKKHAEAAKRHDADMAERRAEAASSDKTVGGAGVSS
jgi:tetratricopeptide (TPR) repeat protein